MRTHRRIAALTLLAIAIGCALLLRLDVSEEYAEGSRVEVAWGQGDGQVPATMSKSGSLFGVRAFGCGSDGAVYLVDSARGRVLKYDRAGELQAVLGAGRGRMAVDDVCVLADGTVVVADNQAVALVAVSSERPPSLLWHGKSTDARVRVIESVQAATRSGGPAGVLASYSTWSGGQFTRTLSFIREGGVEEVITQSAVSSPDAVEPCPVAGFCASVRGGYYTLLQSGDAFTRTVRRTDAGGGIQAEYRIVSDRALQSVSLLGDDRKGRLYAGLDLGTPDGRVVVLDGGGRTIAVVPAAYLGKHRSSTYARADAAGNIYLLESGEHSAVIRRLEARKKWAVSIRGRG